MGTCKPRIWYIFWLAVSIMFYIHKKRWWFPMIVLSFRSFQGSRVVLIESNQCQQKLGNLNFTAFLEWFFNAHLVLAAKPTFNQYVFINGRPMIHRNFVSDCCSSSLRDVPFCFFGVEPPRTEVGWWIPPHCWWLNPFRFWYLIFDPHSWA